MKNKIFARIIITTLLVTFLTFNVGRVTRVSAVGTTIAASAAAALCAVGIVYCSYMALTGASIHVPDSVENIETWLQDMGTKVVQYPSGRAAYEEIYPQILGPGTIVHDFLDSEVWTWTADKIKAWTNDFSSTAVIGNIAEYVQHNDISATPTNGFEYPFTLSFAPDLYYDYGPNGWGYYPFSYFTSYTFEFPTGSIAILNVSHDLVHTNATNQIRNKLLPNGKYQAEEYVNGTWTTFNTTQGVYRINSSNQIRLVGGDSSGYSENVSTSYSASQQTDYPLFPQEVIYVQATDTYLPMTVPQEYEIVKNPQWPTLPPDDDNKPVIPYVKLPFDPNWIDPITNLPTGGGNWGLNLGDLLDKLEDLSGTLMEIGAIGELINQFKNLISGQAGDEYYIYYDDSENDETFYQYYTITNYNGDVYQYDIDVSDADEHLPVDLNTIQVYTDNNYVNTVKGHARKFGEAIGEYVAFWHNSDPESLYTILGSFVVILIGAFIGKWGHS